MVNLQMAINGIIVPIGLMVLSRDPFLIQKNEMLPGLEIFVSTHMCKKISH